MATLDELLDRRERLEEMREAGVRRVSYADGSETEYRSDAEMAAALANLDRKIAAASSGSRVSIIRISSSKGF